MPLDLLQYNLMVVDEFEKKNLDNLTYEYKQPEKNGVFFAFGDITIWLDNEKYATSLYFISECKYLIAIINEPYAWLNFLIKLKEIFMLQQKF